jgi:tripartite ATP-independent transporter DctP family solute receptor
MKQTKTITSFTVVFVAMLLLFPLSTATVAAKTTLIKAHFTNNPGEPQIIAGELFKKIVEEKTNGNIKIEIYPNNQLGESRSVLEGIQLGTVQMANVTGPMLSFVPELVIFELPFLFKNRDHMYAVMDSDIGDSLKPHFEKRGFHLLGFWDVGVRHILTVEKPINSMADLKGLKIRTMGNPAHLDAYRAFGASPLPMAYGELYTALEQKVIDGAEAANINYESKKFYEPAPHWAQVGWIHLVGYTVLSKKLYDGLSKEYKQIIDDAAKEMNDLERKLYREKDEGLLPELEKRGVKVTYPDRKAFMEASKQVYEKWAKKIPGGMKTIEKIINYK